MLLGQWMGPVGNGTNKGFVIVNFESYIEREGMWTGRFCFTDDDKTLANFFGIVQIKKEGDKYNGLAFDFFISNTEKNILESRDSWLTHHRESNFPKLIKITNGVCDGSILKAQYQSDASTNGDFIVHKIDTDTVISPKKIFTWKDFKAWIDSRKKGLLFRGQRDSQKLKTSFHRHGRNDLIRYFQNDFQTLGHNMNSLKDYTYNLNDSTDRNALISVAQHHGFPTPCLDWTESPYIAAFFAFEGIDKRNVNQISNVRIFVFDYGEWSKPENPNYYIKGNFLDTRPSLVFHLFPAVNNDRALPQQSVFMFSNISDIESWVHHCEGIGKEYLYCFDLPYSERQLAMDDLRSMGVTHASLFPGKDGICKSLRERLF